MKIDFNNIKNKTLEILKLAKDEIVSNIKTKWIGFFVAAVAWILTVAFLISYSGIAEELFSGGVIAFAVTGIILFLVLSLFRQTSALAPVILMVCDFMCLISFIGAGGIVDYFSTVFFDGFSIGKIFELPSSVWFSVLAFIFSFIIASVAMYLPQNRKDKNAVSQNGNTGNEVNGGEAEAVSEEINAVVSEAAGEPAI